MAKFGEHFPETIGFIVGNQDQAIVRNNYKKYILKDPNVSNGTFVKFPEKSETIQLTAGACLALTPDDYTIVVIVWPISSIKNWLPNVDYQRKKRAQCINISHSFNVLLTVHLSIFILVINQLDAQNLLYNKFTSCLYIFRAPCARNMYRHEINVL